MAVTEQQTIFDYTASAGATAFSYQCRVLSAADLVISVDGVDGTLGLDYSVTGVLSDGGGSVVFGEAMAGGEKVKIRRVTRLVRPTDYQTAGDFRAAVVNPDIDRAILALQDLLAGAVEIRNSLRVPAGESVASLPGAGARANTIQAFDGQGNPIVVAALPAGTQYQFGVPFNDQFAGAADVAAYALSADPGLLKNLKLWAGGVKQRGGIDYTWNHGEPYIVRPIEPFPADANVEIEYTQALPIGVSDASTANFLNALGHNAPGTVGARLGEYKSVRDAPFNALGNGVSDDTAAITAAIAGGGNVVIPYGSTFRISSYIRIPSNTCLVILGTVLLAGRNAGFYSLNAENVGVWGYKVGAFRDATVTAGYVWNIGTVVAPAIHIRSSSNVTVDGLNFRYCNAGVYHSNALQNTNSGSGFTLTGALCTNVVFSNNDLHMIEMGSVSGYTSTEVSYIGNRVGRSGDGGMWMMGCQNFKVLNNHRGGAQTSAADCALYGSNNPARPTTWNDAQGIEFENCHFGLISGNHYKNICFLPLDIKNGCSDILVTDEWLINCESAGIVIREGDTVKSACYRITVESCQFFNLGTPQIGELNLYQGGIVAAEGYLIKISDCVFNGWSQVPCIRATGPAGYLLSQYPSNPYQAHISIHGNTGWMKGAFQENIPAAPATSTTQPFIDVAGLYDSVAMGSNTIKADRFLPSDLRINTQGAIRLRYLTQGGVNYPQTASIEGTTICNWVGRGLDVVGVAGMVNAGLTINGVTISGTGDAGINMFDVSGAVLSSLNVSNVGSGAGHPAVNVSGAGTIRAVQVLGANINGREFGGASKMTYGVVIDRGADCKVDNVIVRGATIAPTNFTTIAGEIEVKSTTGFPRSTPATPVGAITPLFTGEEFLASIAGKWFKSIGISANTAWSQTSN